MIRVVLVEDQEMVRGALSALLDIEDDLQVVATARDGLEALEQLRRVEADVIVTDVEMPRMDGIALCKQAREGAPSLRVLVLSTFARAGYLERALAAGASGYLLKDSPANTLAAAIRAAVEGRKTIDPELAAAACTEPDPLTRREREVLRLAEVGKSTEQMAASMDLAEGTVRNYLSSAMGKLDARNRTEAAATARAKGWL